MNHSALEWYALATLLWQSSQFYIQLVYKATLPFTLTSKNLAYSEPKKYTFKVKINISQTFMLIKLLVQTLQSTETLAKLKKNSNTALAAQTVKFMSQMWLLDQLYIKMAI